MEYKKPELVFRKFYTESFLAGAETVSSTDSDSGDLEHGTFDSVISSGADGWMNG
ncbi:MAG: hypothetical protein ACI4RB_05005 [Acutalibacteraceae bacterium]